MILALDKWQGRADAERCPNDPEHGRLTAHGSGAALVCGSCKTRDTVGIPVDNAMIAEALAYVDAH